MRSSQSYGGLFYLFYIYADSANRGIPHTLVNLILIIEPLGMVPIFVFNGINVEKYFHRSSEICRRRHSMNIT